MMDSPQSAKPPSTRPWPSLHPDAFHGLAGAIVRRIEPCTEADPAGILVQLLVALGNAIGRSAHFAVEGSVHYLNLYVVLVGLTAGGRKGSSWTHARNMVAAADPLWARDHIMSGLTTGEGLIWRIRDSDGAQPNADKSVADQRLLMYESEFAPVLEVTTRASNSLSPVLRLAWDGSVLQTLTKTSPIRSSFAHVSVVGHITRDELQHIATPRILHNGLANRFLWTAVRRSKMLPDGSDLKTADLQAYTEEVGSVIDFARQTGRMERDAGAAEAWRANYCTLTSEVRGPLGALAARVAPQTMRLACIYALLDRSRVVRREHLFAGMHVAAYSMASAQWAFGGSAGNHGRSGGDDGGSGVGAGVGTGHRDADRILQALREAPGGLTRTAVHELFRHNRSRDALDAALRVLQENDLAERRMEPGASFNMLERWILKPAAHSTAAVPLDVPDTARGLP